MSAETSMVIPFDPDNGELPEALDHSPSESGEVLVLLADPAVRSDGWGSRAAVGLARGWAGSSHRVLLLDGSVDEPALHTAVGEENTEGVTDSVLYGVSPSRIARTVDGGFLLATAGTVAADSAAVFRHPRWTSVLAACRDSGALVLLYLPEGEPGVDALTALADRVVHLKSGPEPAAGGGQGGVTLHPAGSAMAAASGGGAGATGVGAADIPSSPASAETGKKGGWRGGGARDTSPPSSQTARERSPEPVRGDRDTAEPGDGAPTDRSSPKPPVAPRSVREPGRRFLLLILVLVLVTLVLIGAAFLGLVEIPGITPEPSAAGLSVASAGSP